MAKYLLRSREGGKEGGEAWRVFGEPDARVQHHIPPPHPIMMMMMMARPSNNATPISERWRNKAFLMELRLVIDSILSHMTVPQKNAQQSETSCKFRSCTDP